MKIQSEKKPRYFSPLRYPGGKTFLSQQIAEIIAQKGLVQVTYVEPYAGGAGAALALLSSKQVKQVIINDLDSAIYAFWKSAVFESEKFIAKIRRTPLTVAEWLKQKKVYSSPDSCLFELGFATFYLNRTNISGILDGGPIGGLGQSGKWKIDARFNKTALIERIRNLARMKGQIRVYNKDGVDLIDKYLNRDNTLIYLDPPYYAKGASLYLNHYNDEEHKRLATRLNRSAKSNWILTYDNQSEIRALYRQRTIIRYSLRYNAYQSRVGKEIMILSENLRDTVKKRRN